MSISNDLIERTNTLFESIKDDPEFQYDDDDLEEKDLISEIQKGPDDPDAPDDIHLIFNIEKIKIIKNINTTPNLIIYPYFLDFLPMRLIKHEIKCIVKDKYVPRDEINMMLFKRQCVNENKNIKFIFPKNCIVNIPNKLDINEFGREIIHLSIHYIHSKKVYMLSGILCLNLFFHDNLGVDKSYLF